MIQTRDTRSRAKTFKVNLLKASPVALLLLLALGLLPSNLTSDHSGQQVVATESSLSDITSPSDFPQIQIKNFGRMDENLYRGAQPKAEDYVALAALGIRTIIDLRDDPTRYEKAKAEAAGMRYVNIPMSDKDKPGDDKVGTFLALANDPTSQPLYVHCVGGRHRTGLIGAVYRFAKYGWDFDKAYQEMKNYDYYSRWGHGAIKEYVQEYYAQNKTNRTPILSDASQAIAPASQPVTAPPPPQYKE